MDADQRQFAGRLRIGVAHARCVAFVPRGDEFDAGFDQRMGDLEIGGAKKTEAAARAVSGEVAGDHLSDCWSARHAVVLPPFSAQKASQYKAILHATLSAERARHGMAPAGIRFG